MSRFQRFRFLHLFRRRREILSGDRLRRRSRLRRRRRNDSVFGDLAAAEDR